MSSPSTLARTDWTLITSRTILNSFTSFEAPRMILSFTGELTAPRILSTAWSSVMPWVESSSIAVMMSPDMTPALEAGVSSIGLTTLIRPSSCVTSMPRPPNSPLVCTCMSR